MSRVEIERKVNLRTNQVAFHVHLNPGGVMIFDNEVAAQAYAIAAEAMIKESRRIDEMKERPA